MPKQAFPAAAEGMPRINRRAILGGIAAAPALVVPAAAQDLTDKLSVWSAETAENPKLIALGTETAAIETEYFEAAACERAILAAWRPRWPDAPRDIQCGRGHNGALERGIDGWAIRRRDEHGQAYSQQIRTATELQRWVEQIEAEIPHAKSPRSRKGGNQALEDFRRQRDIAIAYEGECARIRKESGYDAAYERRQAAEERLAGHISAILREEAQTVRGIVMQAQALNAARDMRLLFRSAHEAECGINWGGTLAASIVRISKGGLAT